MKEYFILVDVVRGMGDPGKPATFVRIQLKDARGCRPAATTATDSTPARSYMKNYKNVLAGVRAFTRYRDELERRVN